VDFSGLPKSLKSLAGAGGFKPPHGGTKIRWRHLYCKVDVRYSYCCASIVKQVVAVGLRAQILFWSFHGRAKMRMPRPARIVEYGARESDKIGIASSNDRLS
jgi:hypothetical protein